MIKNLFHSFTFGLFAILISCTGDTNSTSSEIVNNPLQPKIDGQLDFAILEKYQTLDPIKIHDVTSFYINSQIYESLLRFDEYDLSLQPMIAKSWQVSENNLVYTFNLRKGIYFHDDPCFPDGKGRELKSSDVLYTFKRIYSDIQKNYINKTFKNKIVGGEKFYNDNETPIEEKDLKGVKLIDDYTVQITLIQPFATFLEVLATVSTAIVPFEAIENNSIVGTGPFVYNEKDDTPESIILSKNNNYYLKDDKGVQLPYLSSVAYNYVKSGQNQLELFLEGKLDIVTDLPPESIKEIVNNQIASFQKKPVKYVLGRYPKISTSYLDLNNGIAPLNDKKVRQAIAAAIDKGRLVSEVLKEEAFGPGNHGIIPPSIKNYDYSSIVGIEYNVEKAKQLLEEAGYPNGDKFPTLQFTTGKTNTDVRAALNIQKQLMANLNVKIEILSVSLAEKLEIKQSGKGHILLNSWLADFPDPISFLDLFYSGYLPKNLKDPSYINVTRYANSEFDGFYLKALSTLDVQQKYELCLQADQLIAKDVPSIPLWYHENFRLIQGSVKNYQPNSMNVEYLTNVKIVELQPATTK